MSEQMYLLTLCLPLATIAFVFGMRSFAAVRQARARLDQDGAYRRVAEAAAAAQAETAATLAEIKTRLAVIEKILKDVE